MTSPDRKFIFAGLITTVVTSGLGVGALLWVNQRYTDQQRKDLDAASTQVNESLIPLEGTIYIRATQVNEMQTRVSRIETLLPPYLTRQAVLRPTPTPSVTATPHR